MMEKGNISNTARHTLTQETPSADMIDAMVRRIVDEVHPKRIVLFGSAARGDLQPHSDLDLLIVMPEGIHRRQAAQRIYRSLAGLGCSKDIVVVTEDDVRRYADDPSLVVNPALREGKELYGAV